jgi:hypothetical protein
MKAKTKNKEKRRRNNPEIRTNLSDRKMSKKLEEGDLGFSDLAAFSDPFTDFFPASVAGSVPSDFSLFAFIAMI